jgi:very-short-patch-repair endonuclease
MPDGMDLALLRQLVTSAAESLTAYSHEKLAGACTALGLPEPPGEDEGSKRQRVSVSLAALPDRGLPAVAERILAGLLPVPLRAAERNAIQDALWAGQGAAEIPKKTRRDIARDLGFDDPAIRREGFMALLDRLWVLDDPFFGPWVRKESLRERIDRHVFRFPGDWTAEELFEETGAFEASDSRFARFLEGIASCAVIPDESAQREIAVAVNRHLLPAGAEMLETATDGGYPVFTVVRALAGRARTPKNVIFASPIKPDIRLSDAVDNDIEIVSNADRVLVYDRPTGPAGVRWSDLQAWWKDEQGIADDEEARKSLYLRLQSSLPADSPPQRNLYVLYHQIHGDAVRSLPALLPEVWLHWDPKTIRDRGPRALRQHRMDFLLLLPHGQRVVLEVDGAHHYADPSGKADPARYAEGARGDRELKLAGYEVFRFGAVELLDLKQARDLLSRFFADLFRRLGVTWKAQDEG